MDDVFVSFSPIGEGEAGSGRTNAEGVYTLKTSLGEPGAGVKPGKYKVTLSKLHGEWDGKSVQENPGGEPIKLVKTTELMPQEYTTKSKTKLEATVTEDKTKNVFDFDVPKK